MIEPMKAITIYQPHASLLAIRAKLYETRRWTTKYRGPIAIHAGMNLILPHENIKLWHGVVDAMPAPSYVFGEVPFFVTSEGKMLYRSQFPLGAIIATAELVECHRIQKDPKTHRYCGYDNRGNVTNLPSFLAQSELLFGDWTPGRYAWEFTNVQMLPEPIPVRGRQGLWNWEGYAA